MIRDHYYDAAGGGGGTGGERGNEQHLTSFKKFTFALGLFEACGAVVIILTIIWLNAYRGGFTWDDTMLVFNYHPLFMVLGMLFLYGNAILAYRVFRHERKILVKILHAAIHGFAWLFAVIGLKAVFDHHNREEPPIPNLYSLHSWLGLLTIIGFSAQYVMGLVTYLVPGLPMPIRRWYMPWHVNAGLIMFVLFTATALTGLTETAVYTLNGKNGAPRYSELPAEGKLINCIGIFLVIKAIALMYIVTHPHFKRPPEDDQMIRLSDLED